MKITPHKKNLLKWGSFLVVIMGFICASAGTVLAFNEVKYDREITEHLKKPIDSAVSSEGDIYILDQSLARVFVFNAQGQLKSSFGERGSLSGQMYYPRSIALNQLGEVIIVDTGNTRVNIYSREGHFRYQLGNEGKNKGEFEKPISVTVNPLGYIYVADGHLKKIAKYSPKGVFLDEIRLDYKPTDITFDAQNNLYVLSNELGSIRKYENEILTKEIILEKKGVNLLKEATGLSLDDNGNSYTITLHDNSIYKFSQEEQIIFSFGSKGEGRGQFTSPSGIVYWRGYLYIADTQNQRLQVFELQTEQSRHSQVALFQGETPLIEYVESHYVSNFIRDLSVLGENELYALSDSKGCIFKDSPERKVLGMNGDNLSELLMPKSFTVKDSGEILVADTKNNRVQFLNADGSYGYKFGVKGRNQSQFNQLGGIAVNKDGYIYVADTKNHRVQVFNRDGIYLDSFGEKTVFLDDGNPTPGTFLEPTSLEFDSQGNLFVLDYRNKRVQIFNSSGKFLSQIFLKGLKNEFQDPVDIAVDENDYLYVADRGDHSIKIFDPEHNFVYKFGSEGKGPSYFPNLSAVDCVNNRIYVADYNVDSVKVFAFNNAFSQKMNAQKNFPERVTENQDARIGKKEVSAEDEIEDKEKTQEGIAPQFAKKEVSPEKLFLSRVTYALGYVSLPQEAKLLMLRKDLANNGMLPESILDQMVIEREEKIDDERVRVVVSVPKE